MFMFDNTLYMTLSDIETFNSFSFIIFLKQYKNYMLIIGQWKQMNRNHKALDVFKLYCVRILFTEIAE